MLVLRRQQTKMFRSKDRDKITLFSIFFSLSRRLEIGAESESLNMHKFIIFMKRKIYPSYVVIVGAHGWIFFTLILFSLSYLFCICYGFIELARTPII